MIYEKRNLENIEKLADHTKEKALQWYDYCKKNNIEMKKTDEECPTYPTHFNDIELQNVEVTRGFNFELHLDGKFLHYRAATNWHSNWRDTQDPLQKKTEIFNQIIESVLKD